VLDVLNQDGFTPNCKIIRSASACGTGSKIGEYIGIGRNLSFTDLDWGTKPAFFSFLQNPEEKVGN
jgi:hypothetical protein